MDKLRNYLKKLNDDPKLASSPLLLIDYIIDELQGRVDTWQKELKAEYELRSGIISHHQKLINDLQEMKLIINTKG
jgi:hypothetical protein